MINHLNTLGEQINTGKNGELITAARKLVAAYNQKAPELAMINEQLHELRKQMNDAVGVGAVIVSSDGWQGNALEVIPALRMYDEDFPARKLSTGDVTIPKITAHGSFLDKKSNKTSHIMDKSQDYSNPAHLARKAVEFQEAESKAGRHVCITEAVSIVSGKSNFSEGSHAVPEANIFPNERRTEKGDVSKSFVSAVEAANRLAEKAREFQESEEQSGRSISITEAVAAVKANMNYSDVPSTGGSSFYFGK